MPVTRMHKIDRNNYEQDGRIEPLPFLSPIVGRAACAELIGQALDFNIIAEDQPPTLVGWAPYTHIAREAVDVDIDDYWIVRLE